VALVFKDCVKELHKFHHPAGSTGLWKQLAGAYGTFPVGFLKPAGDTLEEFVTHV
jgi:hypothetical protein